MGECAAPSRGAASVPRRLGSETGRAPPASAPGAGRRAASAVGSVSRRRISRNVGLNVRAHVLQPPVLAHGRACGYPPKAGQPVVDRVL